MEKRSEKKFWGKKCNWVHGTSLFCDVLSIVSSSKNFLEVIWCGLLLLLVNKTCLFFYYYFSLINLLKRKKREEKDIPSKIKYVVNTNVFTRKRDSQKSQSTWRHTKKKFSISYLLRKDLSAGFFFFTSTFTVSLCRRGYVFVMPCIYGKFLLNIFCQMAKFYGGSFFKG